MIEEQSHTAHGVTPPPRDVQQAFFRGLRQTCPNCGTGGLYRAYLKVRDTCPSCGEELHHHRADDAPPYFTMLITGHIVVGLLLSVETAYKPPLWLHAVIWPAMIVAMSLWLLPRIKGALVGVQWALRMHGFSGKPDEIEIAPEARLPQG